MSRRLDLRRRLLDPSVTTTTYVDDALCTPFNLPSEGIIILDASSTITLTSNVAFQPKCAGTSTPDFEDLQSPTAITDLREPFYASTIPQTYVIAAATVLSYMLVIMLLITRRTFYVGGVSGRGFLGGRRLIRGASGRSSVVGVGGRPWLQKVAALTVAISLTIATADTFKVAEQQYQQGSMSAAKLRDEVVAGMEIRISRVISDTFLWLAQVQTLVRLFPRHREKVIIKWTGFALIVLDTIFAILNNFVYRGEARPRRYVDAIPALSYLFALALSLLYAAWVIYYSFSKRRFAYYHSKMHNICLVAILALASILIPIIFFVIDISKPDVAGWGDYIRWVGAAAASVVVWEWVERIEALEREERKDGVLGREIFDGDEMLDITPSEEVNWPRNSRSGGPGDAGLGITNSGGGGGGGSGGTDDDDNHGGSGREGGNMLGSVVRGGRVARGDEELGISSSNDLGAAAHHRHSRAPTAPRAIVKVPRGLFRPSIRASVAAGTIAAPPAALTPVSRTDTVSADSTVYAVHYHPISESNTPIPEEDAPTDRGAPAARHHRGSSGGGRAGDGLNDVTRDEAHRPGRPADISHLPRSRSSL